MTSFGEEFHRPCPGQSQPICELYILVLRGIIEHQARLIADYVRREQGGRVTRTWIDEVTGMGDGGSGGNFDGDGSNGG